MATLTLPGGAIISGTPEQITQWAKQFNIANDSSRFYQSSTHGPILIESMETRHLRNAMLKLQREWAESLSGLDRMPLIMALRNNNTDKTFVALLTEYTKRVAAGQV